MDDQHLIAQRMHELYDEYLFLSQYVPDSASLGIEKSENKSVHEKKEDISKVNSLDQHLQNCLNDIMEWKDVATQLNFQINRYYDKYGYNHTIVQEMYEGPMPNLYQFRGLLKDYNDSLLEKDAALKILEKNYIKSLDRIQELIKENKKLAKDLEKYNQKIEDENQIIADTKLIIDEREQLISQLEKLKENIDHDQADYNSIVELMSEKLGKKEEECAALEKLVEDKANMCKEFKNKFYSLKTQLDNTFSREEHQKAVDECHKLYEELRRSYFKESSEISKKINSVNLEKMELDEQLSKSKTYVHFLSSQVYGMRSSMRKHESKLYRKNSEIHALSISKRKLQKQLKEIVLICSNFINDRLNILETLHSQEVENAVLKREVKKKSTEYGVVLHKLKEQRMKTKNVIAEIEGKEKAASRAWYRSGKEVAHLRSLLSSKDDTIASLLKDYRLMQMKRELASN